MTDWRTRGACYATFNPDFFAAPGGRRDMERAVAICRTCEVTAECLDYAQERKLYYGVYGGLSHRARRRLRNRRAA